MVVDYAMASLLPFKVGEINGFCEAQPIFCVLLISKKMTVTFGLCPCRCSLQTRIVGYEKYFVLYVDGARGGRGWDFGRR